jgi:hypothetical protein
VGEQAVAAIERHSELWDALAREEASPVVQLSWARAWAETVGRGRTARFAVGDGALLPLVTRGPSLELLGERELFEPGDVLGDPRALRLPRLPFLLRRVPPSLAFLGRATAAPGAPVLRFPHEPSSRRASDLRRAERRAGETTVDVSRDPAALDEAFAVEARSWKGREGTALASDPERGAFYRRYAELSAAAGELRVSFRRKDGRAIAMQIAVERAQRIWLLKIGYDEEFARASPGQLLIRATIEDAEARGLEALEFLGTASAWTRAWTKEEHPYVRVAGWRPW